MFKWEWTDVYLKAMRKKISIKLALQTERQEVKQLEHILKVKIIGGSKGVAGIRPPDPNFFIFMQFLAQRFAN